MWLTLSVKSALKEEAKEYFSSPIFYDINGNDVISDYTMNEDTTVWYGQGFHVEKGKICNEEYRQAAQDEIEHLGKYKVMA